ncbi:hypothetical protein GOP47_0004003 [Adiantum capillus-veneris]|uniref:Uncharacterized protein n=1 Tax=Adiantum capillus-veneris TaxID=13818 RepID=A0A9D4V6P2_ADICA|nr:hypothetical protein GOP47_0004003 [Adiantum capillus-veneris]
MLVWKRYASFKKTWVSLPYFGRLHECYLLPFVAADSLMESQLSKVALSLMRRPAVKYLHFNGTTCQASDCRHCLEDMDHSFHGSRRIHSQLEYKGVSYCHEDCQNIFEVSRLSLTAMQGLTRKASEFKLVLDSDIIGIMLDTDLGKLCEEAFFCRYRHQQQLQVCSWCWMKALECLGTWSAMRQIF